MPTKPRRKKTTFKAAAAVCGAGSLGWCPLVGLVPCYPVCHLLPAFVNRGFLVSLQPLPSPLLFAWAPPVADTWRFLLNVVSFSCHLAMKRSAASRTPRYHLPALLAATVHTSASNPKINLECSVDPLVASNVWGRQAGIYADSSVVHPVSGRSHRSSSRASPAWVIAPRLVVPRPPRRRAVVYGSSFRHSRILSS